MKKFTLINSDSSVEFNTDFIPTAIAFSKFGEDENGMRFVRQNPPKVEDVVSAINEIGVYNFDNGQSLIKNSLI